MHDVLHGNYIQLEPISCNHADGLRHAANDEQIWRYMPEKATAGFFDVWFNNTLDKQSVDEQLTYVVRDKASQVILGATAFYDIQLDNKRLALGYSWYTPAVWGSKVNAESKLLMLTQAFEQWSMNRIEIGTDSRNTHSYKAILKLGATEEGRLRQHMILHDGAVTDTIMFSILRSEWATVKKGLIKRLSI